MRKSREQFVFRIKNQKKTKQRKDFCRFLLIGLKQLEDLEEENV